MYKTDFYKEIRENDMVIVNGEIYTRDGFYVGKETDMYERFVERAA